MVNLWSLKTYEYVQIYRKEIGSDPYEWNLLCYTYDWTTYISNLKSEVYKVLLITLCENKYAFKVYMK